MIVQKPKSGDLAAMLDKEIGDKNRAEFVRRFLINTAEILDGDFRQYLAYGAYWWTLKRLLINEGFTQFGTQYDEEWADRMQYDEDSHTIAACWHYHRERFDAGMLYNFEHLIFVDNANMEFLLGDDELEMIQVAESLS